MKLTKSMFGNWYWVEDENGKRVSRRFKISGQYKYGPITRCSLNSSILGVGYGNIIITPDQYFFTDIFDYSIEVIKDKYYNISIDHGKINRSYNKYGILIGKDMHVLDYNEELGILTVKKDGKIGYLDEMLNWLVNPKFLASTPFVLGRAVVEVEEGISVIIDTKGNYICKPFSGVVAEFILGDKPLIDIRVGNYHGVINFEGKVIIPAEYKNIQKCDDFFKLSLNGKYGLADDKGKIILECIYPEIIELKDKFVIPEIRVSEIPKK